MFSAAARDRIFLTAGPETTSCFSNRLRSTTDPTGRLRCHAAMTPHQPGVTARAARTAIAVLAVFVVSRPTIVLAADGGPATRPDLSTPAAAFAAFSRAIEDGNTANLAAIVTG